MARNSVKGAASRALKADQKARDKASAQRTHDSFQNVLAGLGIGTDNIMSGSGYGFNPISRVRTELEWVHRGSWLGGVAVDLVADDMTRAGITLKGDVKPEDIEKLDEAATTMHLWQQINEVIKWSRLYGGCIGFMMIDGQKPETPLNVERVGEDQFKGILPLDRWQVNPSLENLVTDFGPDFGLPKYYTVNSDASALRGMKVHYTRCLRLEGIRLPYWQRLQENLWGISVLERLWDRMVAFDSATTGAAQLVYKAFLRTYKIEGLREIMAVGGKAEQALIKQVQWMRLTQSNEGITLLDAKDDFAVAQHSAFSGLSDALVQFGQQLAGALQIPLVRLFGEAPAGLNSSGESDLRTYYDGIKQQQEARLRVPVTNIYRMLAQSIGVNLPEGTAIEFNPLWQLNDAERAEVAGAVTTAVVQAEEAGVISRGTALKELKQSSARTQIFTNIDDEEIEEADAELPPSVQEALGAAQEQGEEAPQSATEMILGKDPSEGGGEEQGTQDAATPQSAKGNVSHSSANPSQLRPQSGPVKGGSGGPHAKWEETKHKRAGAGQTIGKSKGGQFVSKGGGSGTKGNSQPATEPVQTAQLRKKFKELERQILL